MPLTESALIVIDVQQGFNDDSWGRRNNPDCEANVQSLVRAWASADLPIVLVHHDSTSPSSPLAAGSPGNTYKGFLSEVRPNVEISKTVHSAFYGQPNLEHWLNDMALTSVTVCGITTDHCCETTTRMAGDLGFDTFLILDATHTFDRQHPDGTLVTADDISRATAASLHGEFATVLSTGAAVSALAANGASAQRT